MTMKVPIASYIDHTLLKATCRSADIRKLCREAIEFKFAAVCVPPFLVKQAVEALKGSAGKNGNRDWFPNGLFFPGFKII